MKLRIRFDAFKVKGEKAPISGQYVRRGPRGSKGSEVTVVKNEPLPPAPKKGSTYDLADITKHKK